MKTIPTLSAFLLCLIFMSPSYASVMVYEDFDYGHTSRIVDQGNGGVGWSGTWTVTGGPNLIRTATSGFPSTNTAFPFDRTGGRLGHNDQANSANRSFASPVNLAQDGEVYFSFLMSYPDTGYSTALTFTHSGSESVAVSFDGSVITATAGTGSGASSGSFAVNTEYFVVGKIATSAAGNDVLSVNVFKDGNVVPETESFMVSSSGFSLGGTLTGIEFTQGDSANNDGDYAFLDEFRMGSSWDAVAIPEASSLVLMLSALAATGYVYLRRKSCWGCCFGQ